ncbi:response regulator [Methanophagales archaeon]|nr:MAG: response regulator [Methanophagales archaeon]
MTRGRVLVAEGSVFMRIMLTTTLERLGFEVVATANNGKEAVDGYMELRPDIVLVDVELKDMDAIEITRVIANEDPSAVVIILIPESMDVPDIIVDAVRAGAKGYMRKPISAEEIEAHIRSAMRRR